MFDQPKKKKPLMLKIAQFGANFSRNQYEAVDKKGKIPGEKKCVI
jgi:hypothetical protein